MNQLGVLGDIVKALFEGYLFFFREPARGSS